uniref:Uncharacterized protein n=1 Tax=Ananas comosus var. bracteatus TaxID=296719 RepID=A0A6V7PUD2_ANACO|nr:unnamed protein product [Ananas comosus var. bracteatus]
MMSSRVAKLNGNIPSSTMRIEAKSVKFSEGNQDAPQNATSSKPYSLNKEKHVLLSPLLKRKTLEGSVTDLKALTPLKRIMESPAEQRKSPNISSKSASDLVPVTESQKALTDNTVTSTGLNVMGSISDFEMPSLVENDVNVEKAEACAKELDDICNMLKKKNEEAKELLVRAIVNNNALLMLNHPMYEEKISFTAVSFRHPATANSVNNQLVQSRLLDRKELMNASEESEAGLTTTVFRGRSGGEDTADSVYDSKRLSPGGPDPQHHSMGPYSYAVSVHSRP